MQITTVYADGRTEVRDMTEEEIAAAEADRMRAVEEIREAEARAQARNLLVSSTRNKFAELGFTTDEIDIFIPGVPNV